MVRFVTIKKFCELTGFTAAAIYKRKASGFWPEGSVWRYAPGSKEILIDLHTYDAWVENGSDPSPVRMHSPTMFPVETAVIGTADAQIQRAANNEAQPHAAKARSGDRIDQHDGLLWWFPTYESLRKLRIAATSALEHGAARQRLPNRAQRQTVSPGDLCDTDSAA